MISYTTGFIVPDGFVPPIRLAIVQIGARKLLCEDRTKETKIGQVVTVAKDKKTKLFFCR
jgi:hypothetical protein